MKLIRTTLAFLLLTTPAFAASAPTVPAPAKIQFDQFGGIKSWRTGGDSIVFVQDSKGQWYKAVMFEPCMTLNTKNGVSFVTEVDPATNQKTSKVMVDRHICTVDTMTKVDAPPAAK